MNPLRSSWGYCPLKPAQVFYNQLVCHSSLACIYLCNGVSVYVVCAITSGTEVAFKCNESDGRELILSSDPIQPRWLWVA